MIKFPRIQQTEAGTVEIDLIQVQIIRIFPGLAAIGGEVEDPFFVVDPDDVFAMPCAAGDLVL